MTDHVTTASHPELTEDQRARANQIATMWLYSRTRKDGAWGTRPHEEVEYANAVERIVAEVTA